MSLRRSESGFALAIVLWVLAIAAIVGLTLAHAVGSEVRMAIAEQDSLQAELLAESGIAFADLIAASAVRLGTDDENFGGLPVEPVVPGFRYLLTLPEGDVDLYFEGEDGKINLTTAPEAMLTRFFTEWTGNTGRAFRIAESIRRWRGDTGPRGEALPGTRPREGAIGMGDPLLFEGLERTDFTDRVIESPGGFELRPGLTAFVTTDPTEESINPNLAPRRVLLAIPDLSASSVDQILTQKARSPLEDRDDMSARVSGVGPLVWEHLRFGAPSVPANLAVGRSDGGAIRAVRRVFRPIAELDRLTGLVRNQLRPNRLERNLLPEFALE